MNQLQVKPEDIKRALRKTGLEKYKVRNFSNNSDDIRFTLYDKCSGTEVSGKIVRSFNEGEVYHWPELNHENIAPLINILHINKNLNIFITISQEIQLKNIIHDENFLYDSKCFFRKKAYARDIFSGLAYLHTQSLCLMNLSDSNIVINKYSDRAILTNFQALSFCKNINVSKFPVPKLYRAPEVEKKEFEPIAAEIWASGVLMLDMFLAHMIPWAIVEFKSSRVNEIVDKLTFEALQAANTGSVLSFVAIQSFKTFLNCFFKENPATRISAKDASIASFLRGKTRKILAPTDMLYDLSSRQCSDDSKGSHVGFLRDGFTQTSKQSILKENSLEKLEIMNANNNEDQSEAQMSVGEELFSSETLIGNNPPLQSQDLVQQQFSAMMHYATSKNNPFLKTSKGAEDNERSSPLSKIKVVCHHSKSLSDMESIEGDFEKYQFVAKCNSFPGDDCRSQNPCMHVANELNLFNLGQGESPISVKIEQIDDETLRTTNLSDKQETISEHKAENSINDSMSIQGILQKIKFLKDLKKLYRLTGESDYSLEKRELLKNEFEKLLRQERNRLRQAFGTESPKNADKPKMKSASSQYPARKQQWFLHEKVNDHFHQEESPSNITYKNLPRNVYPVKKRESYIRAIHQSEVIPINAEESEPKRESSSRNDIEIPSPCGIVQSPKSRKEGKTEVKKSKINTNVKPESNKKKYARKQSDANRREKEESKSKKDLFTPPKAERTRRGCLPFSLCRGGRVQNPPALCETCKTNIAAEE